MSLSFPRTVEADVEEKEEESFFWQSFLLTLVEHYHELRKEVYKERLTILIPGVFVMII